MVLGFCLLASIFFLIHFFTQSPTIKSQYFVQYLCRLTILSTHLNTTPKVHGTSRYTAKTTTCIILLQINGNSNFTVNRRLVSWECAATFLLLKTFICKRLLKGKAWFTVVNCGGIFSFCPLTLGKNIFVSIKLTSASISLVSFLAPPGFICPYFTWMNALTNNQPCKSWRWTLPSHHGEGSLICTTLVQKPQSD